MTDQARYCVFVGSGCHVPSQVVRNADFSGHRFFDAKGNPIDASGEETVRKFEEITGIFERRYVTHDLVASDIAFFAARDALESSGIDPETLDFVIVAHNFGDIQRANRRSDFVPSLAARVKHRLEIANPKTIAYDVPFGCPGWMLGVIQANCFLSQGAGRRALVIGAETLSRVCDPHDRDSMLYSDGAGAAILESNANPQPVGILASSSRSDTRNHAHMLWMDRSCNPDYPGDELFLKMHGHQLYKYALKTVPMTVMESLNEAGIAFEQVSKILIHQANEKMDREIVRRLFQINGRKDITDEEISEVMPMIISRLGNSSVATVPTLLDRLWKGEVPGHRVKSGDVLVLASVGAGMNVISMVYRIP